MNKINISSDISARMVNREGTENLAHSLLPEHIAELSLPGQIKPSHFPLQPGAESAHSSHFDPSQMKLVDLQQLRGGFSLVHEFSPLFLREAGLYPYRAEEGSIRLAVADLAKREAIEAVLLTLRGPVVIEHAAIEDIEIALESEMARTHAQDLQGLADADGSAGDQGAAHEDVDNLRDLASGAPVVQALDQIFDRAVALRATDIHIEPFKRDLRVRVRVDGILRSLSAPRGIAARALVSRIKILSGLNIAEHRLPQDGRTRINLRSREFDIRVATMPTTAGEAAILRLLERGTKLVEFSQIGLNWRDEAVLRRQLARPHGLLVVTGPTGSGKTTTLAAGLATLNDASRKILTIEDPVEYEIPGVNQSQVRPAVGLTFATALRAFLRQDPDVIMVGEVRDSETAKIAIQASLTGHLVLTTLHTNNAAAAITRLVDVGVEPFLIASTLTSVLGQRLVRTLCPDCKQPFVLRSKDLDADPRFSALGFKIGATLHQAVGCERCGHTGYRGRVAIFEVLEVTEAIRKLILSGANDTIIEQTARAEGMTTMVEDGLLRCYKGITTVDEVLRVAVWQ
jgi:general secretion pathway protein E